MAKPLVPIYDSTHSLAPEMAWLMLETELEREDGNLLDATGHEHIGTGISDPYTLYDFGDDGIFFNVSAGESNLTNFDFDSSLTFWFAFWINPSIQVHSLATLLETNDLYGLGINGTKFDFYDLFHSVHNLSMTDVEVGVWQHILVSSDDGDVSLYINGVLEFTCTPDMSHFAPNYYGEGQAFVTGYNGYMDSIYFTPDAFLDATEAAALYLDHWAAFRGIIVEDTLTLLEDISKSYAKSVTDILSLSDHEAINLPDESVTDTLSLTESRLPRYYYVRSLSDSLSIFDDLDYIYDRWELIYERLRLDHLTITESIFFTRISQISFDDDLEFKDTHPLVLNYFTVINVPNLVGVLNNDTPAM